LRLFFYHNIHINKITIAAVAEIAKQIGLSNSQIFRAMIANQKNKMKK
jgi:hypothetical protein